MGEVDEEIKREWGLVQISVIKAILIGLISLPALLQMLFFFIIFHLPTDPKK